MTSSKEQALEFIAEAERNRSELECIEFKDMRGGFSGNSVWKSISSFSHRPEGGYIVFGVAEDSNGKIDFVGVGDQSARHKESMVTFCKDDMVSCFDPIFYDIEYKGVQLLASYIRHIPDELKPCFRKSLGVPNGACIRVANVDKVISVAEAREFMRNSTPFKYDHLQAEDVSMEDLSSEKIVSFLERSAQRTDRPSLQLTEVGAFRSTVRNLGIADEFDGTVTPTRAGFLIFATRPPQLKRAFSRYVIRCVHYKGVSPASPIIDRQDLDGTLDDQIEAMQAFILKSIPLQAKIVGTKRVDQYEYPPDAIREIVANAVIHRDYNTIETYTQVSVFSNRIEVVNAGNLPPGITVENIKESQFSRNITIASILKDMNYMEEYGRGIDIVVSTMNEYGLMPPIFKNAANTFKVILLGKEFVNLNRRQLVVWQLLQTTDKTITSAECVTMFDGVSKSTVSNDLNSLVDMGLIEKVGAGPSTHYKALY